MQGCRDEEMKTSKIRSTRFHGVSTNNWIWVNN